MRCRARRSASCAETSCAGWCAAKRSSSDRSRHRQARTMTCKIGIDVGGTFTDFIVTRDGADPLLHKVLSTPADPSEAVAAGLAELAALQAPPQTLGQFIAQVDTIVHGTTVTTNATLTHTRSEEHTSEL